MTKESRSSRASPEGLVIFSPYIRGQQATLQGHQPHTCPLKSCLSKPPHPNPFVPAYPQMHRASFKKQNTPQTVTLESPAALGLRSIQFWESFIYEYLHTYEYKMRCQSSYFRINYRSKVQSKKLTEGTFLAVLWLRLCTSTAGGHRSDPWSGNPHTACRTVQPKNS